MITLTVKDLILLKPSLEKLIKCSEEEPLDFSLTYKLSRIINKVQSALIEYYQKRDEFIRKLGVEEIEKDKEGNIVMVKDKDEKEIPKRTGIFGISPNNENFIEYFEKNNILLEEMIEMTSVFPLKFEELKEVKIPISDMPGLLLIMEKELEEIKKEEIKKEQ